MHMQYLCWLNTTLPWLFFIIYIFPVFLSFFLYLSLCTLNGAWKFHSSINMFERYVRLRREMGNQLSADCAISFVFALRRTLPIYNLYTTTCNAYRPAYAIMSRYAHPDPPINTMRRVCTAVI